MPYKDKQKQADYQAAWLKQRRDEWFSENGPCVKCGSTDRMELDHIEPDKKVSHRIWSWSEERRLVELAKCQVLCYNCHKDKHFGHIPEHGVAGYARKCRCQVCRDAKWEKNAKWRMDRFGSLSSHNRVAA